MGWSFGPVYNLAEWCIFWLLYWVFSFPISHFWVFPIINMKVQIWARRHVCMWGRSWEPKWYYSFILHPPPTKEPRQSSRLRVSLAINVCHSFIQICIKVSKMSKRTKKTTQSCIYRRWNFAVFLILNLLPFGMSNRAKNIENCC